MKNLLAPTLLALAAFAAAAPQTAVGVRGEGTLTPKDGDAVTFRANLGSGSDSKQDLTGVFDLRVRDASGKLVYALATGQSHGDTTVVGKLVSRDGFADADVEGRLILPDPANPKRKITKIGTIHMSFSSLAKKVETSTSGDVKVQFHAKDGSTDWNYAGRIEQGRIHIWPAKTA